MNTTGKLHLILKYKWFDMIEMGIKTEEYREISQYWKNRFEKNSYSQVCFHRGYTNLCITKKILRIKKGIGKPEWGAPANEVYILKLK